MTKKKKAAKVKGRGGRRDGRRDGGTGRGPKNEKDKTAADVQGEVETKRGELEAVETELQDLTENESSFIENLVDAEGLSMEEAVEKTAGIRATLETKSKALGMELGVFQKRFNETQKAEAVKRQAELLKQGKDLCKKFTEIGKQTVLAVSAIMDARRKLKTYYEDHAAALRDYKKVGEVSGNTALPFPPMDVFLREVPYYSKENDIGSYRLATLFSEARASSVTRCAIDENEADCELRQKRKANQEQLNADLEQIRVRQRLINIGKAEFMKLFKGSPIPNSADKYSTVTTLDSKIVLFKDGEIQFPPEDELIETGKRMEAALPVAELAGAGV